MVQQTKTVASLLIGIWIVISLFYYSNFNCIPKSYANGVQNFKNLKLLNPELWSYKDTEDYLIKTPGCYIPNYIKTLQFIEAKDQKETCGVRAVFIKNDGIHITFHINETLMRKHIGNQRYECCYQYATRSTVAGQEDIHVTYSKCTKFSNGTVTELKEEVIRVSCIAIASAKQKKKRRYDDAYVILKKLQTDDNEVGKNWNVLILGMDTMSRGRMLSTMPATVRHFRQHGWLDYRGYQKVGYNTFPNLMAFLTGRNTSKIYKMCAKGMSSCNDEIIWKKFRKNGYITAYGEDFLDLPDTFYSYHGFKTAPTNHYLRPFFLTGEIVKGNIVCTQKLPSAIHALEYAVRFVDLYKDNKFFGMFWLNSYSHNTYNLPTLLDHDLAHFLEKINMTGALKNTFIFVLSDHGLRFGKMRLPVESYYEERLPMLFMWVPLDFRNIYKESYYNLKLNQNRLTTPYDLHETFRSILQLSSGVNIGEKSEACPECTSLFEEKTEDRTCEKAKVDEKWCSCHNLTKVDKRDYGVDHSIQLAVSYIQNVSKTISTKRCTRCYAFKLKDVIRTHSDVNLVRNTTNYVIAFDMYPGNVAYEASVQENENGFTILQPTQTISPYNVKGRCVVHPNDRAYCVCEQLKHCR